MRSELEQTQHPVLLYDDQCPLCKRSLLWSLKRLHSQSVLEAVAWDSPKGTALAREYFGGAAPDSLVFVSGKQALYYSSAPLGLARLFRFPSRLLTIFAIVPKAWRDAAYKKVAARRRKLGISPLTDQEDHELDRLIAEKAHCNS